MLKRLFSFFLLIILTCAVYGQTKNQRDAAGLKQGYWEAVDRSGMPVYRGYFKNDKPVGEMTRYFPTGEVRIIMHYDDTGVNARARLFWQNGRPAAIGIYINTKRDSIWLFYAQNGKLSSRVEYSAGEKNGTEQKFFSDENVLAEEINWKNGIKHGAWKQYHANERLKLSANYINGALEGAYVSFFPNGIKELEGVYRNGVPDGEWIRHKDDGEYAITIKYDKGTITNMEDLEEAEYIFFRKATEAEEYMPEPTIDDLFR